MTGLLLNVTPNFPYPRYPFSGIFLARQLTSLQEIGWDSITVHPQAVFSRQRLGTPRQERGSLRVYRPGYLWGGWKLPRLLPFDESWAFERSLMRCARRVILPHQKPDIVVCNWLYPGGPGCVRLASELKVPVLLVARGGDVRRLASMDKTRRQRILATLADAEGIATNGQGLRGELSEVSPELASRAIALDFGVDTQSFHPATPAQRAESRLRLKLDPAGRTLLVVGRWEVDKGSRDLLAVLSRVLPRHPRWSLLVAGPIVDRESADALSADLGARFLGLVAPEELPDVYRAADAFLLLSHREGQPNVVKEAMASGLAVLAYRVGGVPEVVEDSVNGLLVEHRAIEGAVESLQRLLADDRLREDLALAGRKKIEIAHGLPGRMALFGDLLDDLVRRGAR